MPDKLVTIAGYSTLAEASMARDQLEAEGVKAVLADAEAVGMAWYLTSAFGGVKLQVMDVDVDRAISILGGDDVMPIGDGESPPDEIGEGFERDSDIADDEEPESPTDEVINRAFRAALLGVIFLPLQLYSVWLLLRIPRDHEPLSSENRRRVLAAVVLDTWMLVLFAVFAWTVSLATRR
jgi:hypothetical protein